MKGSKIELLMICPARASSTKPTTEASEVFLTICTMKPTVGGVAMPHRLRQHDLDHALRRG